MRNIGLTLLFLAFTAHAESDWHFSGFGTFGFVTSDSKTLGFRTDTARGKASFKNEYDFQSTSVLGGQLEYTFNEEFEAVLQMVHRDQDDFTLNDYTNLAFLRYSPNPDWSLRLGRTAIDLFQLTEFRNIGFAYPWAKVPTEVYGLVPYRYVDGLDASYTHPYQSGNFRVKAFIGESKSAFSISRKPEEIEVHNITGLVIGFDTFDWSINARYTEAKLANEIETTKGLIGFVQMIPVEYWPSRNDYIEQLSLQDKRVRYSSISARYDYENWQFLSEVSHIEGEGIVIRNVNMGYLSASYRFNEHQFFGIYGFSDSENYTLSDPNFDPKNFPPDIQAGVGYINDAANFFASNQSTYSLGWRWDISETLTFKLQWDNTKVEQGGATLWLFADSYNYNPGERSNVPGETINVYLANVSFTF